MGETMRFLVSGMFLSAIFLLGSATVGTANSFNCNDPVPRSDAYDSGNYAAAFKELEPLANERCAEAEHLLGVMYAKGQGVQKDLVRAYALLLLADSDGLEPVGGKVMIPVIGDDNGELEIVQFGAQLTADQLDQAEGLALKLAAKRGKFANADTAGPSRVSKTAKELRPRVTGYKLNDKPATVELPNVATATSLGMSATAPGHILTQIVTDANARVIPYQLVFIEMRLSAMARGVPGSDDELKRVMELSINQGERFAWLKAGASVRIVKFAVNGGFAAQVELLDGPKPDAAKQRYWIDSCYLTMKDAQDQVLWGVARGTSCDR
jgi:hypothetical protein